MKHLIIGTAGHVDHGKTALVKMLTDIDCDTHKEEKVRGITINLGFSHIVLPSGESAGIIDVPGHKDFINTMVGGACGIDMVLLVIAADSGIMPQTLEHINIITSLGIKKGVIALTKTDLVDEELLELARFEISDFLKKSSLENAPIIGVSSVTGKGKDELLTAINQIVAEIEEREPGNLFRMYIDRIFTVRGFGSVVTGSVMGGTLSLDEDVYLLPGLRSKLRVRSIERHGQAVEKVVRGDRAAINLIGLKNEDFKRGMILCKKLLDPTLLIDAHISFFMNILPLTLWSEVIFITGTFECRARMHLINKDSVNPGDTAIIQLHLALPAVLENQDRFILRNSAADTTLGGGYIIDTFPLHHRKRPPQLVEQLTQLAERISDDNNTDQKIFMQLKREFRPFTLEEIAEKLNLTPSDLNINTENEIKQFEIYKGTATIILVHTTYDKLFMNKITDSLVDYHKKNPLLHTGLDSVELSGKLGVSKLKCGKTYIELLLAKMKTLKLLENYNDTWIISGYQPGCDKKTMEEINWLETEILNYGNNKPSPSEIELKAFDHAISKASLKMYLSYLAGKKKIKIFNGEYVHSKILDDHRKMLLNFLSDKPNGISIHEFKSLIGGTKPFRALLGEIFESEKIIRFVHGNDNETRILLR